MKASLLRRAIFLLLLPALCLSFSCNKAPAPQPEAQQPAAAKPPTPSVPNVKVTQPVQAKANAPTPGPKAKKEKVADTFGKGKASITVKGHPGGVHHSFWAEDVDVDGSGNPVQTDEVWDNHHKVLYLSNDRSFSCGNGQSGSGSTIMAVYAKGNTLKKTPGSGWWMTELAAGSCGVQDAGLYGCRFDADGNNTECGIGTIQSDADDVTIVPLPGAQPDASGSGGSNSAAPAQPSVPAPGSNGSQNSPNQ
jgi:hypothetical protein